MCLLFLSSSQASSVFILPCLDSPLGMNQEMSGIQLCLVLTWCAVVVTVCIAKVLMLKLQQIYSVFKGKIHPEICLCANLCLVGVIFSF